jgi:hypothetical protein
MYFLLSSNPFVDYSLSRKNEKTTKKYCFIFLFLLGGGGVGWVGKSAYAVLK